MNELNVINNDVVTVEDKNFFNDQIDLIMLNCKSKLNTFTKVY